MARQGTPRCFRTCIRGRFIATVALFGAAVVLLSAGSWTRPAQAESAVLSDAHQRLTERVARALEQGQVQANAGAHVNGDVVAALERLTEVANNLADPRAMHVTGTDLEYLWALEEAFQRTRLAMLQLAAGLRAYAHRQGAGSNDGRGIRARESGVGQPDRPSEASPPGPPPPSSRRPAGTAPAPSPPPVASARTGSLSSLDPETALVVLGQVHDESRDKRLTVLQALGTAQALRQRLDGMIGSIPYTDPARPSLSALSQLLNATLVDLGDATQAYADVMRDAELARVRGEVGKVDDVLARAARANLKADRALVRLDGVEDGMEKARQGRSSLD